MKHFFQFFPDTQWHVFKAIYKWRHTKAQFMEQQKNNFVCKHVVATNVLTENTTDGSSCLS